MAFYTSGIVAGVLLTRARRYLASGWLWGGVALALLIFLPNLIWQIRHGFISLQFLQHIHKRDVGEGRSDGFLPRSVHDLHEPLYSSAVDRRTARVLAGPALSHAGVDVSGPAWDCTCWGKGGAITSERRIRC